MAAGRLIYLTGSRSWDGVARYVLDLCRHFRSAGWSVTAYTPDATAVDRWFLREGIALRHVPLSGFADIYTLSKLVRDLKSEPRGAVIHVNRLRDAFIALLARKLARRKDMKVVLTRHVAEVGRDSRVARRIYRNLDAMIFSSAYSASLFASGWEGKPLPFNRERVKVLHYAVESHETHPVPEPEKGPKVALWHGRITPEKGLETLLDALTFLKKKRIRLQIAGTGNPDYVDTLRRRAALNGVLQMIDWKGRFTSIWELTAISHFGVTTATGNGAFGYTNLDYMAAGRAQITTPHPIQTEYLSDGKEALFVAPGNPEALAEAMLRLAGDDELRNELGLAALRRCRADLSWERLTIAMEEIYREVAGDGNQ